MRNISLSRWASVLAVIAGSWGMVLATQTTAYADTASGRTSVTISPASTAISLPPGGSHLYNITIFNSGDSDYTAHIYADPYHVVGINYDPAFTQLPGTTDPSAWVNPAKSAVTVPAHETVIVPYTLTIPPRTAPGGYYTVIFVETQPTGSSGVSVLNRVGDVLYITAQGHVKTGGSIINVTMPHFSTASSVPLALETSNTGGNHYLTDAAISVSNILGKENYGAHLERYVLPQTIRLVSTDWKTPPFGYYKVYRSATVNGELESLPTQWIIIVHPWIIITLAVLLATLVALHFVKQKIGKKDNP